MSAWAHGARLVRALVAFGRRDALLRGANPLATLTSLVTLAVALAVLYFISALLRGADVELLRPYRGGYFAFVVLGLGQAQLFGQSTRGLASVVRTGQLDGTLAAMLGTPTSPAMVMLGPALPSLGAQAVRFAVLVATSAVLFDFPWRGIAWPATLAVLALSLAAFAPFGLLGAAYVIWSKADEPFSSALAALTALLGGVYFPRALLPGWLQCAGDLLPVTHATLALRAAMLEGASLDSLAPSLWLLAGFALVGGLVGSGAVALAVYDVRRRGSFAEV